MSALRRVLSASCKVHLPGNSHADDVSGYGATTTYNGSYADGAFNGHTVFSHDGTNDTCDAGDIGTIRTIAFLVNPGSTTEELILIDTGKDIMVSSGTITYTGVTGSVTYVDGERSTTLVANKWQHVVCVLSADVDANNFQTATDGTNYGDVDMSHVRAFDFVPTDDEIVALCRYDKVT